MSLPPVVDRTEWLAARRALLEEEKALTRARDALSARRRMLPMVEVEKEYRFTGPDGPLTLRDLFGPHRQLIVQHVMFGPDWDDPCPGCSAAADEHAAGLDAHLRARDTAFVAVSRASIERLSAARADRGWVFPWVSSAGSDFNYDFHVSLDPERAPVAFNFRDATELEAAGMGWLTEGPSEQPGFSVFLRQGDRVFHTYSTYARGMEAVGGGYYFLDLTPLGRQEDWEEPKGRVADPGPPRPDFGD